MDWTAIGALGEVVGAIAVVISIAYLAAQVKHNTEATRWGAFQSVIDRVSAVNSRSGDPHVADVIARGRRSYLDLSEADRVPGTRLLLSVTGWSSRRFALQRALNGAKLARRRNA